MQEYTPHGRWRQLLIDLPNGEPFLRVLVDCSSPWKELAMAMSRPKDAEGLRSTRASAWKPDDLFGNAFPQLCDYLCTEAWDDGLARRTSTITVFVEDGLVKLCLADRALSRNTFVSAATFSEALCELEERLAAGRVEWRPQVRQEGNGKRRG